MELHLFDYEKLLLETSFRKNQSLGISSGAPLLPFFAPMMPLLPYLYEAFVHYLLSILYQYSSLALFQYFPINFES